MPVKIISRRIALLCAGGSALLPLTGWAATLPQIQVYKDPDCGCCEGWVAHLKRHSFNVDVVETAELQALKVRLGIPTDLIACHTAQIAGYLIEGHVPASAIERMLRERPEARGLAVPGMPQGAPGMTGDFEEYEVILFESDKRRVYGKFKGEQEL